MSLLLLGCTGKYGSFYIREFIKENRTPYILARNPSKIKQEYGDKIHVIQGNMMNSSDICQAFNEMPKTERIGIFLSTPMGPLDDASGELKSAEALIEAIKLSNIHQDLFHIIQISVLSTKKPTGCQTIDIKQIIENYLQTKNISFTSLRAGTYMDDMFATQIDSIRRGFYSPILSDQARIHLTDPRDLARVAISILDHPINGHIDVIDPTVYTINDIKIHLEKIFKSNNQSIHFFPPARIVQLALGPAKLLTRFSNPIGYSVLRILNSLYQLDFTGDPESMKTLVANIQATKLDDYLDRLNKNLL